MRAGKRKFYYRAINMMNDMCNVYYWYCIDPFIQKCVIIKIEPWISFTTMQVCERSNKMCRYVRCKPGIINRM